MSGCSNQEQPLEDDFKCDVRVVRQDRGWGIFDVICDDWWEERCWGSSIEAI